MGREFGLRMLMLNCLIVMMVSISMIRSVEMVYINGLRGIDTMDVSSMMLDMGMGRCIGLMGVVIWECGRRDISGEKDR